MKYFSAFAGIGGFDEGIRRVLPDSECVGYSEIDKYAVKIYDKHFTNRINYGNIKEINGKGLPDFDLFCGGFPCQDLSIAGKRAGLCGARSGLFHEIIRIIREKQPVTVFLENVTGLLSSNGGWDFATVLTELEKVGYDCEWDVLNSKNFGVPQNRERVFIIGHLRGKSWKPVFPLGESIEGDIEPQEDPFGEGKRIRCKDPSDIAGSLRVGGGDTKDLIASTLAQRDYKGGNNLIQIAGTSQADRVYSTNGLNKCLSNGGGQGAKTGLYQIPMRKVSNTIDSTGILREAGHRVSQNDSIIRRLTPIECERLQGYPDGWTLGLSDTQRYKCLGNAVTVNVIEAIISKIIRGK